MCCLPLSTYHWCTVQVWLQHTAYSNIVLLLYLYIREQEPDYKPIRLVSTGCSPPTTAQTLWHKPVSGSQLYAAYVRPLESDLEALQGSREALKSRPVTHCSRTGLDVVTCGGLGFNVILLILHDGHLLGVCKKLHELLTHQHVSSLCQMCTVHVKAHLKMVSKKENRHWCDWGTKNNSWLSQSHSPFFNVSFSTAVASRLVTQPLKTSLWLSVVMETSQVSVVPAAALAVHCGIYSSVLKMNTVRPNVARPSAKPTNQPTNFCCILSVWTLAGNLRMLPGAENLKVTSILFCS